MEIWKDVKGYEGLYKVSNLGRVKSLRFTNNKTSFEREKIIKTVKSPKRREYATLYKNGKRKNALVHRLVASAFLDNSLNLPEVNHIDGNPLNNNVDNLEWCTKHENMQHAYNNDLNHFKSHNEATKKPIIREDGKIYSCAYELAKELGLTVYTVRDALKGRIKTCGGYKVKYLGMGECEK